MQDILLFIDSEYNNHFKINYPYYGLFGTAEVTDLCTNAEILYNCHLLNGENIRLKKIIQVNKWIDADLNKETSLSNVLGSSIDDFLNGAIDNNKKGSRSGPLQ